MKAAVLKELNGPPVFDDFEDPVAGEGQAVVEIAAAAIHHVDLARASGTFYLGPPPLPSVLGVDGVGRRRPVPWAHRSPQLGDAVKIRPAPGGDNAFASYPANPRFLEFCAF